MRRYLHDAYAALSHLPDVGDGTTRPRLNPAIPTWVPDQDARRLAAYQSLRAYVDNVRRYWLPDDMWETNGIPVETEQGRMSIEGGGAPAAKFREYGHAALIVDSARAVTLGESQAVTVPAAAEEGADQLAVDALDLLTGWAEKERLTAALHVVEGHANTEGDGIMALAWSQAKRRPILRTYDPGFYFPDLHAALHLEGWDQDWPPVVHIAYEIPHPKIKDVTLLRRHTYQMAKLENAVTAPWGTREWTCWYRVEQWRTDRLKGKPIYALPAGEELEEPVDLLIDFIPVVHLPNTEPGGDVFGRSTLTRVAQVLDDLAGSDTDLALTAEVLASPPTYSTGGDAPGDLPAGPGVSWHKQDGSISVLDTSKVLDAGVIQNKRLIEGLAVNSRLALAILGRISPADVPSGLAYSLGFVASKQLIREQRAVRVWKHSLLLKFVLRLYQANRVLGPGETPVARVALGPALPSDLAAVIEEVRDLLGAKAISTRTAVAMLIEAGLPIEDLDDELAAIRADDVEGAKGVVEATGDTQAARDRLGLTGPGPEPLPVPVPDPQPTDPPVEQ